MSLLINKKKMNLILFKAFVNLIIILSYIYNILNYYRLLKR